MRRAFTFIRRILSPRRSFVQVVYEDRGPSVGQLEFTSLWAKREGGGKCARHECTSVVNEVSTNDFLTLLGAQELGELDPQQRPLVAK